LGKLKLRASYKIRGETPGRQTVPRAELFGAIVLITRVHYNVCVRLGIDAAYVTNGVLKRARLDRGSNGDLWGLFFMVMDLRTADLHIEKVASHIEGQAFDAVKWGYAELVGIIGSALADEAAELTVALIRPSQETIVEAKQTHQMAMAVCTRIGFIQARLWELFGNAPIHEAPSAKDEEPITNDKALETLMEDMKRTGHILERRMRGPRSMDIEAELEYDPNKNREAARKTIRGQAGLFCIKCNRFRRPEGFNK